MSFQIALFGYAAAAIAFLSLAGLLLTKWRQRARGSLMIPAAIAATIWAAVLAWMSTKPAISQARILVFEMAHDAVWLLFLSSLLGGAVATQPNWLVRRGGVALGGVLLIGALLLNILNVGQHLPGFAGSMLVIGSIGTSLYALVGIEQLYRNARPAQKNGLKFLCLGLAGIFAYDILMYSNAVIDDEIRQGYWAARGFVVALCVPLLAVSIQRISTWRSGIFASRRIVFYTTTLFAAGMYLLVIGLAGYYIQNLGKEWGDVLSLVFFSAAVIGFFALLMSEQLRARIRIWLIKHFFERKYDYRAEWLRLIDTLTGSEDGLPLKKRAIKALAQILGTPSGRLWLVDSDRDTVRVVAGWNMAVDETSVPMNSPLGSFLSAKGWVIDIKECGETPSKYEPLQVSELPVDVAQAGYIIPLFHEAALFGFVSLSKAKTPFTLTFEDHDLLKTAGQQIASHLSQERATEHLAESRQFEAYNRFTAFVMHDLKNAIAQQSLVVENAEKHKHNPEFIDDAIETIKGSVERMRRVLGHLRQNVLYQANETIDLGRIVLEATSHCADREPIPEAKVPDASVFVSANRERLASAVNHAIRNAQEACGKDGQVCIELAADGGQCRMIVTDTGAGMDQTFIRDRLFRPFDSTKGAEGMGIGAYQVRETLRAAGGDVEVTSALGDGTSFVMILPISDRGRA